MLTAKEGSKGQDIFGVLSFRDLKNVDGPPREDYFSFRGDMCYGDPYRQT